MSDVLGRQAIRRRAFRRPGPRLVVVVLAVLIALAGVTAGGCLYINHVAAGMGRVPVMFVARTPAAPR